MRGVCVRLQARMLVALEISIASATSRVEVTLMLADDASVEAQAFQNIGGSVQDKPEPPATEGAPEGPQQMQEVATERSTTGAEYLKAVLGIGRSTGGAALSLQPPPTSLVPTPADSESPLGKTRVLPSDDTGGDPASHRSPTRPLDKIIVTNGEARDVPEKAAAVDGTDWELDPHYCRAEIECISSRVVRSLDPREEPGPQVAAPKAVTTAAKGPGRSARGQRSHCLATGSCTRESGGRDGNPTKPPRDGAPKLLFCMAALGKSMLVVFIIGCVFVAPRLATPDPCGGASAEHKLHLPRDVSITTLGGVLHNATWWNEARQSGPRCADHLAPACEPRGGESHASPVATLTKKACCNSTADGTASPDGSRIATGSEDDTVMLWDAWSSSCSACSSASSRTACTPTGILTSTATTTASRRSRRSRSSVRSCRGSHWTQRPIARRWGLRSPSCSAFLRRSPCSTRPPLTRR